MLSHCTKRHDHNTIHYNKKTKIYTHRRQNSGKNKTNTVNISKRPNSIPTINTHLDIVFIAQKALNPTPIWNQTGSLTINPASGTAIQSSNFGLTIAGNGSSTISGTIGLGTGTLTTNNGTVTLMTSNSSSGSTTVNSGILNIRNNTSLGTGSVSVLNGATLQLQGGISVANQLTLYGVGNGSLGSLRSMSGDNIYNGNITLSTNTVRINTDANILTINGNISGGSIPLYVGGAGNTIMNGVLSGGGGSITWGTSPTQVAASTSFVKDGGGTVDFVGLNTYTGATVLDDGVLELDYRDWQSNREKTL